MTKDFHPRAAGQTTGVIVVATLIVIGLFWLLSGMYFDDRAAIHGMPSDEHILNVRISFIVFSAISAGGGVAAAYMPRIVGHGLAGLIGILAVVGAFGSISKDFHVVAPASLFLLAGVLVVLVWRSLQFRSRAAWSFLIAICSVGAVVTLFGATKVRNAIGINLYQAMILPGLLTVASIALATIRADYAEKTTES